MTGLVLVTLLSVSGALLQAADTAPAPGGGVRDQGPLPFSYLRGEPMRIGNEIQFLMDDYMVEDRWKLTRTTAPVAKHLRNPVVVQDQPWEDAIGAYPSVLYDEKSRKYRMWYQCFNLTNYFAHEGPSYYVGYAESDDGFQWTKPHLEGFPFAGYPKTNIVTTGRGNRRASAMQVMLNPDQSDPKKRFMMVYVGDKVDMAYSPDGLHWSIVEKPILQYHSDFPNHLLWIPERELWFLYARPSIRANGTGPLPEGLRHTGRRLALSVSKDLENWTQPRTIVYPDELVQPDYDNFYVFRRHGLFIALYSQMFQEEGNSEADMHVATSRDGIHWQRTWDRKPLVPRGPEGAPDHGLVEPGTSPPIDIGAYSLIYYYMSPAGQAAGTAETGVGVCRMRHDRYIGQQAANQTGYLLTRQFVLEGSKLRINCSSAAGPYQQESDGIRVAIIAAPDFKTRETNMEKSIPGFTLADSDRIVTDNTSHVVTWKGNSDLSSLKGRAVYLRFQLKKATLYTFQIEK